MASSQSNGGNGVYSPELRLHHFHRSITLSIFLWPSLTLAVSSSWGGPTSSSKREWFAGTLIDLLSAPENFDVDAEWIEELLLQVMEDEFEVVVDDGSAAEIAMGIVKCRGECERGVWGDEKSLCYKLEKKWAEKGGNEDSLGAFRQGEDQGDTDGDDDSGDEEDEEGDVEMDEAPQLVRVREPVVPEIDEDGFTKVVKKRR
ncbi:rRNA accumulation- protein [Ciborinia camelliae]|nr:rRNA accumulation- protein [Ciborinia camelliae]